MSDIYLAKIFDKLKKAIRVDDVNSIGSLLSGIQFDDIQTSSIDTLNDRVDYYLAGVLQRSIQVTYSDTTKTNASRARKI